MDDILDLENNNNSINNHSNDDLKTNDIKNDINYSDTELDKNTLINCDFPEETKFDENTNDSLNNNNNFNYDDLLGDFHDSHSEIEKSKEESIIKQNEINTLEKREIDGFQERKETDESKFKKSNKEDQNRSKENKTDFESKFNKQPNSDSKCAVCSKTVYPMEKVTMDSKLYHKNCFRCCVCQKALSPTVVTKFKDNLFCKPHYIEKFRIRGRYDDIGADNSKSDPLIINKNDNEPISRPSTYQYLCNNSSDNNNRKSTTEKFVGTKDLASRFQESFNDDDADNFERKQPINTGFQRRVSDVTKAWIENPGGNQDSSKRGNSNNNSTHDLDKNQVSKGSVKNLKSLFESKN